jgi:hypothetical protein
MSKDKHHSQKKSSDTIHPFEAEWYIRTLLTSVRNMKFGGKRTKDYAKTTKNPRKSKSHKNRRHSSKK